MVSDAELMKEFCGGDLDAFDKLVKRHQVGLLNFFHRLVWDQATAEDLTQEVFLKIYTHRKEFEPKAKFTTYLFKIARNCWVDHLRKTKGDRRNLSLEGQEEDGQGMAGQLAMQVEDPSARVQKEELTDALLDAIEALPEDHRIVFILSEVQGLKYHEIAEAMGIPNGTVKSRMFHAIKRLREILAKDLRGTRGPWSHKTGGNGTEG